MTETVGVNEIVAGKYRVDRVLGQGGMGVVLAVWHLQLEERAAIKIMLPGAAMNAEAVARFLREARAAAKIQSEHVARVRDVGTLENGQPYMVMEYLEGHDLSGVIANRGALPFDEAISYLLQACEALAEAHSIGIVHRDLKPGNLFLTQRRDGSPLVKVLDFGISKVTGAAASDSDAAKTKTSALMGSPLYMSPEQMTSSRDVDARSDIWALGVILYELVAGRVPFDGETLPQVCGSILSGPTPSVRSVRPDLPPELDAILMRCLEKRPDQRYASVADFAQALMPLAPRSSLVSVERISRLVRPSAPLVEYPQAPMSPAQAQTNAGLSASGLSASGAPGYPGTNFDFGSTANQPAKKSRALLWVTLAVVLLGGGGAAAFLALKLRSEPAPAAEAPTTPTPSAAPAAAAASPPEVTAPPVSPAPVASEPSAVAPVVAAPRAAAPRAAKQAAVAIAAPKPAPAPRPATAPAPAPPATTAKASLGGRL